MCVVSSFPIHNYVHSKNFKIQCYWHCYNTHPHTYIHTLLARPQGAFQSQFYITKLKTKYMTMIKEDKG